MDVVFSDLAKAFNKVPLKRLIEKLRKHGIGGRLKCVIESWLGDRGFVLKEQCQNGREY